MTTTLSSFDRFSQPAGVAGGRFSRRTVVAAAAVLERLGHGTFSRLLREFGPSFRTRVRDESVSLMKRCTDLVDLLDDEPTARVDSGDLLSEAIVEKAATLLPKLAPGSDDEELADHAALRRSLRLDGYEVTEGELRRGLPNDLHLPQVQDEVQRLLTKHNLVTAYGHMEQALEAHSRGNWSSANGQLRNLLDSVFDGIAERIDPAAAGLGSGQARRTKLAATGFLSRDLNEWSDDGRGFINGLVSRLHPQGAHPGLSDDEDSTFRLHTVLLTVRLMLVRFDRASGKL